ncbi:tail fiber protein [Sphingomonas sp. AOB5]|uniref:phage tail protein n=1 Tax=Sphingomonas sp. AOB5 TaxID=3034017 RepID=UPI0023F781EC|nr:tail fiber protein [Sphingomonas sp. AOB5]MDF7775185.1 tail fiber protein [Sphingomonas sp. AOB5]
MNYYVGEIRAFTFGFVPKGWLPCDGKTYPFNGTYNALGAVIGNLYGGTSGQSFAVPNLQGATLASWGTSTDGDEYDAGQAFGQATVALSIDQMPPHNHMAKAKVAQTFANMHTTPATGDWISGCVLPTGNVVGAWKKPDYSGNAIFLQMVGSTGDGLPHENRHPYLAMPIGICWSGTFPKKP